MAKRIAHRPPSQRSTQQPPLTAGLTGRRAAFVREYLQDLNATAAYIRAGYNDTPAANKHAHRLLKDPAVQAALAAFEAKANETALTDIKRLERELDHIAIADIRKLFNRDSTLKLPTEWDADTAAAIRSLDIEERTYTDAAGTRVTVRVKKLVRLDAVTALITLLRRLDMASQALLAHTPRAHTGGPGLMEGIDATTAELQADAALLQRAQDEIRAVFGCAPAESAENNSQTGTMPVALTDDHAGPSSPPASAGVSQTVPPRRPPQPLPAPGPTRR